MAALPEVLALLEYRMRAIDIGRIALRHAMAWESPPALRVYFDDLQVMEGSATGFTNGAIESAIIHCRALLEYIGLGLDKSMTLREIRDRRDPDDHGIEQLPGLSRARVPQVLAAYPGPPAEAAAALAHVIYLANKGLGHTSKSFSKHDQGAALLEIAFRGVPVCICNLVYIPLGIEPPHYQVTGRTR